MNKVERVPDWSEIIDEKNALIAALRKALKPFAMELDGGYISNLADLVAAKEAYMLRDKYAVTPIKLSEYEIRILRHINGEKMDGLHWGAAMGEAIEFLHVHGFVDRVYKAPTMVYAISDKGLAAITQETK